MVTSPTTSNRSGKRTRRGLAATGALSLALAGGAFTFASMGTAQAATASGEYNCKVSDMGIPFNDPWTVEMTADLPTQVEPGETIPAPKITAKVTTGDDASNLLRTLGTKTIEEGSATADYKFGDESRTADLTVTGTPITVPAEGGITTTASGTGQEETAPSEPGSIQVSAGDFTAALTTDSGFVANIACTAKDAGGINLGTITVGTPAPTTTEPTTTEPTTTEPSQINVLI